MGRVVPITSQDNMDTMQRNFDKLEQKLDELIGSIPSVYASQKNMDRLEERIMRLEEHNKTGTQWANDEHHRIRTEFLIEIKNLANEMRNTSATAKNLWVPLIVSPVGGLIVGLILHYWH